MQNGLEHEFLEFDDFCSDAAASLPPPVRVKTGVARGLNRDTCRMTFHDPIEHSPHSSRVVSSRHEHNGSELVLVAPWRKHLAFTLGSNVGSGDFHDIRHAEPYQLPNLPCARILVRQPAPDKFVIFPARRVGKNRNARRDAALHEVRHFQRPGAGGIERYDDDVGWRDGLIDDERPSCGSQNGLPDGRHSNDGSRGRCDHHHDRGPTRRPEAYAQVHLQVLRGHMEGKGIEPGWLSC